MPYQGGGGGGGASWQSLLFGTHNNVDLGGLPDATVLFKRALNPWWSLIIFLHAVRKKSSFFLSNGASNDIIEQGGRKILLYLGRVQGFFFLGHKKKHMGQNLAIESLGEFTPVC
ncbi:hypothetical protein ACJX0J_028594 [Zea mays]